MIRKLMLAAVLPVALMAGAVALGSAEEADPCLVPGETQVGPRRAGAGEGIAVVHERAVSVVGPLDRRTVLRTEGEGVPRHPALGKGGALAYVEDLRGPDLLHVAGDPGSPLLGDGEVTHPAWSPGGALAWAEDLARLRLRTPEGALRELGRPGGTEGIFSPVFLGTGTVVAVAMEPVAGYEPEDAALDNLWELDLSTGGWRRRTSFAAHGDAWSTLRTPVVMADGTLRFVRLTGTGSAGAPPAAELWTLDDGGPGFLRLLPADAVLAGRLGERLVLNVPDEESGAHRVVLEGAGAGLGCGTAMADPLDAADPDVVVEDEDEDEGAAEAPVDEAETADGTLAIVVGDFETRAEAEIAASGMAASGPVRVLTHDASPGAVAPGVWALGIEIPEGVPIEEALETFRARFPQYADRSWVTVP